MNRQPRWLRWVPAITLLLAAIALFWALTAWHHHKCQEAGGHRQNLQRTSICVTDDGRILDP